MMRTELAMGMTIIISISGFLVMLISNILLAILGLTAVLIFPTALMGLASAQETTKNIGIKMTVHLNGQKQVTNNNGIGKLPISNDLSKRSSGELSRSLGTINNNLDNNHLPIITSSQISNYSSLQTSASNQGGRVYIPGYNNSVTTTTTPSDNGHRASGGANNTGNSVSTDVRLIQKTLPTNSTDKTPFVIATPATHINNGTSSQAQGRSDSVTLALNLIDKMRILGFDDGIAGSRPSISLSSHSASTPQKSNVFIPPG
jgi:hypothetical protein